MNLSQHIKTILATTALSCFTLTVSAQTTDTVNLEDSTGLAGDNFSLEGALNLFKTSTSPEDFEKKLNEEDSKINNLDLNNDGNTDYIQVIDKNEGDVHAIILRVAVNEKESQDVAVLGLEKTGTDKAVLQITGSEELYGDEKIVEPYDEKENSKGTGPNAIVSFKKIVVNVWMWPCVKFVYAPAYVVWVSPWYWGHYPIWWKPWRAHPWRWHWRACRPHVHFCHVVHVHRVGMAHKVYMPHKKVSVVVVNHHKAAYASFKNKKANPAGMGKKTNANGGNFSGQKQNMNANKKGNSTGGGKGQRHGNGGGGGKRGGGKRGR